jgi:hypothetical protein
LGGIVIASTLALALMLQAAPPIIIPGAVSGRLTTVDGVPAVAVRVVAIAVPRGNGSPGQSPNYFELANPTDRTLTDLEGNFRLQEIVPGRYYILAGANPNGTYYPGTAAIKDAEVLDIQPGIEIPLNIQLLHRLGGKVSGRINANMAELGPRTVTMTGPPLEDGLDVPVKPDGTFEFGHLPPGNRYLVSLWPPTPGIASFPVTVGQADVSGVELTPLPTKTVSGRIVVKNGSIPHGILGFYTVRTYVPGKINVDGTFSVDLHSTQHQIDFAGLPVGYSLASVKIGDRDVTEQGIVVSNANVTDVLITMNAPKKLATVKGKITGLARERFASTGVVMIGPTFNRGQADVEQDGSFQFDAVVPGSYKLSLTGVPEFAPITVIVDGFKTYEVAVTVPSR